METNYDEIRKSINSNLAKDYERVSLEIAIVKELLDEFDHIKAILDTYDETTEIFMVAPIPPLAKRLLKILKQEQAKNT